MKAILFLSGLLIFETLADIAAKEWQTRNSKWLFCLALLCYVIANASWLISLRAGMTLAKGGMVFAVTCAILAIAIGLAYKEPVTKTQIAGFILGIFSLVLIFWDIND